NGLAYSAVEYLEALRWRGPALAAHLDAVGDIDVVIAPTSRSVAPTIVATDLGGMRGSDPGHHTLHAADELSWPAEPGGAGGAIEIGVADRDAAHWPSVWRRNVDRARPCISSCNQSSPADSGAPMTSADAYLARKSLMNALR